MSSYFLIFSSEITSEVSQLLQPGSRLACRGAPFLPSEQSWKAVTREGGEKPPPAPLPPLGLHLLLKRTQGVCDFSVQPSSPWLPFRGLSVFFCTAHLVLFSPRKFPCADPASPPCPDQACVEAHVCWGCLCPWEPTYVTSMVLLVGCTWRCN